MYGLPVTGISLIIYAAVGLTALTIGGTARILARKRRNDR